VYGKILKGVITVTEEKWQDIYASRQTNKILTGVLSAIEKIKTGDGETKECAAIFYNGVKVIIPFEEMGLPRENITIVRSMAGAEIDFVIRAIDADREIAVGSRKFAMALRRKLELPKHNTGDIVQIRIDAIGKNSVIAEVYGIETRIPKEDIDYGYIERINDLLQVGDKIQAKITELNPEQGIVKVSIKEAKPNPFLNAGKKYLKGGEYLGTIKGVKKYGFFVNLERGIDVLCPNTYWKDTPETGDKVTVRITRINNNKQVISGILKRIVRKNKKQA
jgi:small subunit ribosomal protein S1